MHVIVLISFREEDKVILKRCLHTKVISSSEYDDYAKQFNRTVEEVLNTYISLEL